MSAPHADHDRGFDRSPCMAKVLPTRWARRLGWLLAGTIVVAGLAAALLPWQQAAFADGRVVALNPAERPQDLEAPTKGRPAFWYPDLEGLCAESGLEPAEAGRRRDAALAAFAERRRQGAAGLPDLLAELAGRGLARRAVLGMGRGDVPALAEGSRVRAGQPLLEIEDVNADYLNVLRQKAAFAAQKTAAAQGTIDAEQRGLKEELAAREHAIAEVREAVAAADSKVRAYEDAVRVEEEKLRQYSLKYERYVKLEKEAVVSAQDFEAARQDYQSQRQYVSKSKADLEAERRERASKQEKLGKAQRDADAKVADRQGKVRKAEGEAALAAKEAQDAANDLARQFQQTVVAPGNGVVMRLLRNQSGQMVSQGEAVARFVPDAGAIAAELYIDGNDQALVQLGDHVRLQFEGWPAIQFSGWPAVAVGTFGGKVVAVDPADDKGKFRILATPESKYGTDEDWPAGALLRQGVAAKGWVMLREVSLGWEVWRRLNGSPPTRAPGDKGGEKVKFKAK